jgi:hypothetical protein
LKEQARKIEELEQFMVSDKLIHNVNETKHLAMINWINNVRSGAGGVINKVKKYAL